MKELTWTHSGFDSQEKQDHASSSQLDQPQRGLWVFQSAFRWASGAREEKRSGRRHGEQEVSAKIGATNKRRDGQIERALGLDSNHEHPSLL
jgi:hypothetical protein